MSKHGDGLILRVVGVNDLGAIYACNVWEDGELKPLGTYTTMEGREALPHFVRLARAMKFTPEWVVGGTTKDARRLGLDSRLRAPGGGRRRLGDTETKVQRSYWLTQAGVAAIEAAAAASGRTLGEEIEARFLSDNR